MQYIKSYTNDAAIQAAVNDKSLGKPYVALDENTGLIDWNGKRINPRYEYFSIEALENGTLTVRKSCQYSINEGDWVSVTNSADIQVNIGDAVRFKGSLGDTNHMFSGNTIQSNVYGNIMSLAYGDNFRNQTSAFTSTSMFNTYTGLINSDKLILPASKLKNSCYNSMFANCSGLLSAPKLPATTLRVSCYRWMFQNCTSLTSAPELPVTNISSTIITNAYESMFMGCTSLNYIKCLLTNDKGSNTTTNWVVNVSPTGTFVKAANATNWPTGDSGIPSGWTVIEE